MGMGYERVHSNVCIVGIGMGYERIGMGYERVYSNVCVVAIGMGYGRVYSNVCVVEYVQYCS